MTIELDIEEGDIILTGKFKNKRTKVNSIGSDEHGHPTINGKSILNFKIEKLLPQEQKSKKTREQQQEMVMDKRRLQRMAGILKEQDELRDESPPLDSYDPPVREGYYWFYDVEEEYKSSKWDQGWQVVYFDGDDDVSMIGSDEPFTLYEGTPEEYMNLHPQDRRNLVMGRFEGPIASPGE